MSGLLNLDARPVPGPTGNAVLGRVLGGSIRVALKISQRCLWFILVYIRCMNRAGSSVRQSVSLPSRVARRVRAMAKTRKTSANRVLVDLIETGLQTKEGERERFLALARRFKESSDPSESDQLREELARLIFGE